MKSWPYFCDILRTIFLLLCLSGVAACSMAPRYEKPLMPVPDSYMTEAEPPKGGTAATVGWRDYFLDDRMRALIEQSLLHNSDLHAAVFRIEEARALYGIRRSDQLPTFNAEADFGRGRIPDNFNLTGRDNVNNTYQVSLASTAWELDFWGRVHNLTEAALESYLATDAAQKATAISVIAEVANSYLRLAELDERIALAKKSIASRQESVRIFQNQFKEGRVSNLDVTQVETLLKQAQSLTVQLEQARAIETHLLSLLTGYTVKEFDTGGKLDEKVILFPLEPGLPSALLTHRPDIVAAEHQLRAAHANIGAARAAFFPRITLIGSVGEASLEFNELFTPGSYVWNFGPHLSVPIFDAGRNRSNLSLAEARKNISITQYEKTIQTAFREVSDALSSQHWLSEQLKILKENQAVQAERARLAQLRYDNGTAAYLEVLDAQRDLFNAEQQVVQTRRALLSNRVLLYVALGGGLDFSRTASSDTQKK